MLTEAEETYYLVNGLPQPPSYPDAVNMFHQKHGNYPAKVIVNPEHQVKWGEYLIPRRLPIIGPLGNKEIEDHTTEKYNIAIEYDKEIDVKTLICRGFATL